VSPVAGSGTASGGIPGIEDIPRLARWLTAQGLVSQERPAGELPAVHLITGGRSNLTYRLDVGASRLVLRRPPLGHVLPTAHDMAREHRVLSALQGTGIPVPAPLALCLDTGVIGAPFYLMTFVDGVMLRTREDALRLTRDEAAQLSDLLAATLAAIHAVDVTAVGLETFGRPEGYLARQLARWQRQWELSATREVPGYARLVARLGEGLPEGGDGALLHGDFRLDNTLVSLGAPPSVAAVLDWEMSTLGDPLADLGLTLVYWADPVDPDWPDVGVSATTVPGFHSRTGLARRYAELTGRDVSRIGYYTAFGCFKLAVVLEGIHARFLQRKTVGAGFEREGTMVPVLIERAHRLLDSGLLA
jgi:aminoglycoside phosphotransferase (APT) family kinase protein